MATYFGVVRTNYFRVKDADAFRDFISKCHGEQDSIWLWEQNDGDRTIFGFGCYGGIAGLRDENDEDEYNYDAFVDGLQQHLEPDAAILIFEAGSEKFRYVVGAVTAITARSVQYADIQSMGINMVRSELPNWETRCSY